MYMYVCVYIHMYSFLKCTHVHTHTYYMSLNPRNTLSLAHIKELKSTGTENLHLTFTSSTDSLNGIL